jgi:hypothetical protein
MKDLDQWHEGNHTAPELAEAITQGFSAWKAGQRRPVQFFHLRGLNTALSAQDKIGWKEAFEGRWHTSFAQVQNAYFRSLGFARTGRRWLISLIRKMWEIAWDLWEERNGIQEELREQRTREDALERIDKAYAIGPAGLHPGSRRLFTSASLEERKTQTTQSLLSWLLRVELAQRTAQLNPPKLTLDQIKRARQERSRAKKAKDVVQTDRQRTFMTQWRNSTA